MRNEIERTANMRHEGTANGGIVETRKIVALLRKVITFRKQTRPGKAKPIYYRALTLSLSCFSQ